MNNAFQFPKASAPWFAFKNAKKESVDLFLYDVIGDSWAGSDASSVVKEIANHKGKHINVRINSPGGSVFDGYAIYNALKTRSGGVTTYIDGLAASIASVIALAGDEIVMAENAMVMIHNPSSFSFGEADRLRKDADVLDQLKEQLVNIYATASGQPREKVGADVAAETWFNLAEANAYGFGFTAAEPMRMAACVDSAVASAFGFKNAPEGVVPSLSVVPRNLRERRLALLEKE